MREIDLQPVFNYLNKFKKEIISSMQQLERRIGFLENSVDNLTKISITLRDELIVQNHRTNNLEKLISKS